MINLKFVEGDEAVDILLNSDKYFKIMTPQERCIRMGVEYDPIKPISCDEFSEYAKNHVRTFSNIEKKRITNIVKDISNHLVSNGFKGVFPDPVNVILTSGMEDIRECAGYCRKNAICINLRAMQNTLLTLFTHELFHIFSQHNPELREQLYNSLGFYKCNEIEIPTEVIPKTLTNPDAQSHDVFINVKLKNKSTKRKLDDETLITSPTKNETVSVTPVLMYNKDAYGGFFSKLHIGLLRINTTDDEKNKNEYVPYKPNIIDNKESENAQSDQKDYVMYTVDDCEDFWEQVGECHYYFHPDEILATRFASCLVNKIRYDMWHHNGKQEKQMIEILFKTPSAL